MASGIQQERGLGLMPIEDVTHWAMPVNNLREAEACYGDLLGLNPLGRLGNSGRSCVHGGNHHMLLCAHAATGDRSFLEDHTVHHAFPVCPETLGQAGTMFSERQVRIAPWYDREGGFFPGRALYCFAPSGNRLEWRDPTGKACMPQPTFEELVRS